MTHSNWIFLCVGCLSGARPPRCLPFAVGILTKHDSSYYEPESELCSIERLNSPP